MQLKHYWVSLSPDQKRAFSSAIGRSRNYMAQVCHGHATASWELAQVIERVTEGKVTAADVRPDIYGSSSEAGE